MKCLFNATAFALVSVCALCRLCRAHETLLGTCGSGSSGASSDQSGGSSDSQPVGLPQDVELDPRRLFLCTTEESEAAEWPSRIRMDRIKG